MPQTANNKTEKEPTAKSRKDDNIVYVGKKPTMSYVMAVMTQFTSGQKEVFVKARGRSISRAVDVVEAVRNKFVTDLKSEIRTATEGITDNEGRKLNVSLIDIKLNK
jgi:DNA-binding protein